MASLIVPVVILLLSYPMGILLRRFAYFGRRRLSREEVVRLFPQGKNASRGLDFIARAYHVPIGLLRPDDTFTKEGRLWKYDSWSLNYGQEVVNDFLERCGVDSVPHDWTIRDFVEWYGGRRDSGAVKEGCGNGTLS